MIFPVMGRLSDSLSELRIISTTAWKIKIEAASLTTPSPNNIEFNVGNTLSFTIASAATESVAHKMDASKSHSTGLSLFSSSSS